MLEGRKIKVRSTSLPVNCLLKRKLKIPRLFQVAASIRSFWQLLTFSCSSLFACNNQQPGCLVVCMLCMLTVDIWLTSEDVNNRLNYLSSVNFCSSERMWSYDDYGTVKWCFLFFVYSDHHNHQESLWCKIIGWYIYYKIILFFSPDSWRFVASSALVLLKAFKVLKSIIVTFPEEAVACLCSRHDHWGTSFWDCLPSKYFWG